MRVLIFILGLSLWPIGAMSADTPAQVAEAVLQQFEPLIEDSEIEILQDIPMGESREVTYCGGSEVAWTPTWLKELTGAECCKLQVQHYNVDPSTLITFTKGRRRVLSIQEMGAYLTFTDSDYFTMLSCGGRAPSTYQIEAGFTGFIRVSRVRTRR